MSLSKVNKAFCWLNVFGWTQEQVEQSVREKAEMMKELDQIREENETLKKALQKEQQEVDNLKVCLSKLTQHPCDNEHKIDQ